MHNIKIAIFSMIKNECDIVELFIKINSRYVDKIYILDHMSDDGTSDIIDSLIKQGYPVIHEYWNKVFSLKDENTTSKYINKIASKNIYDYIIALDGDEFLTIDTKYIEKNSKKENNSNYELLRTIISKKISKNNYGIAPWLTYMPIKSDYFSSKAPLYENFKLPFENFFNLNKVIIGNEYAKNCKVSSGNHFVSNNKIKCKAEKLPFIIQHVPVRSVEQILKKMVITNFTTEIIFRNSEGSHWRIIKNFIKKKNYLLNFNDLQNISYNYGTEQMSNKSEFVFDDSAPRIGNKDDEIFFKEKSKINLIKSFDEITTKLISELKEIELKKRNKLKNKILKYFNINYYND